MDAMSTSSLSRDGRRSLLRTRGGVVAALSALLVGGAGTGALMATALGDPTSPTAERIAAIVPQVDPKTLSGTAYAGAAPGTCLTWSTDASDRVSTFTTVDCAEPHRFEVAGRIALHEVPGYGRGTPIPEGARLDAVGTDHCRPLLTRYTQGREIDPAGRFTGLVVPPSTEGWEKGDHAVLCGIASSELDGRSATSTGLFAEADQHRWWEPGTCLGFTDEGLPGAPVPCSDDHSIEIVSTVDVSGMFAEGPDAPEARAQSEATADACHAAGADYLGDPEALRRTTLIATLVHPIGAVSWTTGSRTVNCGLMKAADPGPFAVLRGSARQGVLVDGATPVAPTTTQLPPPAPAPDGAPGAGAAPGVVPGAPADSGALAPGQVLPGSP